MRTFCSSLIALGMILLLTGCQNRQQQLTEQLAKVTGEAADLLATVQDEVSAAAAAPKLRELLTQMNRLGEAAEAIEDDCSFSADNEAELSALGSYIAAKTRFTQEQQRIGANQKLREGLGSAWQEMTGSMYDPGGVMAAGGEMDLGTTRQLWQMRLLRNSLKRSKAVRYGGNSRKNRSTAS